MHDSSYTLGRLVLLQHATPGRRVLDVGARSVPVPGEDRGQSLRDFCPTGVEYVGLDQEPGKGVDVVGSCHALPFEDASFDLVLSTSCLEHDPMFWVSFVEMARVLRPGGILYLNVPAKGPYHQHPVDCWRFYPDAWRGLVLWAEREGQSLFLLEQFLATCDDRQAWTDNVMIFGKGPPHCFSNVPSLQTASRS